MNQTNDFEPSRSGTDLSMVLGIVSIACGVVGFILCPIVFGGGGLACGIIGLVRRDGRSKVLPIIGIAVSGISIPIGMVIGFIVASQ